jgi:hypothetical protein
MLNMKHKYRNREEWKVAVAVKSKWTPLSTMTATYKNEVYEVLMIWKSKTVQEVVFNARADTKQNYYLLHLDFQGKVTKIISNPEKYK